MSSFSHKVFTNSLSFAIHTKLFQKHDTHTTTRGWCLHLCVFQVLLTSHPSAFQLPELFDGFTCFHFPLHILFLFKSLELSVILVGVGRYCLHSTVFNRELILHVPSVRCGNAKPGRKKTAFPFDIQDGSTSTLISQPAFLPYSFRDKSRLLLSVPDRSRLCQWVGLLSLVLGSRPEHSGMCAGLLRAQRPCLIRYFFCVTRGYTSGCCVLFHSEERSSPTMEETESQSLFSDFFLLFCFPPLVQMRADFPHQLQHSYPLNFDGCYRC